MDRADRQGDGEAEREGDRVRMISDVDVTVSIIGRFPLEGNIGVVEYLQSWA